MKKDREDYRLFRIWGDMNYRCNSPSCKAYKNYGGRGIKVCDKWRHFQGFKEDMWESYCDHAEKFGVKQTTIDRIDVNGNYCIENCKWSTYKEQRVNVRNKKVYVGTRIEDEYTVLFDNATEFCTNNDLHRPTIMKCVNKQRKTHKGWNFRRASEEDLKTLKLNNSKAPEIN